MWFKHAHQLSLPADASFEFIHFSRGTESEFSPAENIPSILLLLHDALPYFHKRVLDFMTQHGGGVSGFLFVCCFVCLFLNKFKHDM